ncbi:biotin transporter BioY [Paenibacillus mendelii]|uniref:Biotin transporter n=1 Tax=Paenibacillus mendelii TaxID=206163 RepID=A0ABV6J6U5_9BACL|nr:biotin transporter BioY [Paenibacillus mendelii]MCQ6560093.1 biotin transporter BioY [Paenibacillus mendelii]
MTTSTTEPSRKAVNSQAQPVHWIRGMVFTALFAALFIAFSSIIIPLWFTPIPFTLQTLAVMLAGGLLGARYGFWSIALVVLLTATGLPLIHGNGGLSLLLGPTAGFIWMFPFAALLIGWVSDRLFRDKKQLNGKQVMILLISIIVFGVIAVHISGVAWMARKPELSFADALAAASYPFLPGDAIKAVVSALLIRTLRPFLPKLR